MGKAAAYGIRVCIAVAEIQYAGKTANALCKLMLANSHEPISSSLELI
jgi:hypothetical protein